jgi:hypothetical protein
MFGGEERKDMFMAEGGPDLGFMVKTLSGQGRIALPFDI